MTKNRTPTPVYLDPGMHPGLEVKGLNEVKWHCHDMKMGQPVSRTKTRIEINILKDNPENVQTWFYIKYMFLE